MKIRVGSWFSLLIVVSVLFAWHVSNNARTSIVGTWRFPPKGSETTGFDSTLTLRSDGTLLKTENNRKFGVEFHGTWSVEQNGVVVFTVSKKSYTGLLSMEPEEVIDPAESYSFRYAVSDEGKLLLELSESTLPVSIFDDEEVDHHGINWPAIYEPK